MFDVAHTDIRFRRVGTFRAAGTAIKAVEDGIWVGTQDQIHFLRGNDLQEGGFDLEVIANYGIIPGTDITTTGEYIPESKSQGRVIIFTTPRGICTGGANGVFVNHSLNIVSLPEATWGSAMLRDINGIRQYVVTLDSETPYNKYVD
jgi:hypothetical protein